MKKWLLFASVLCLVFIIAACGTNSSKEDNTEATTTNSDSSGAADLVITASNWKFDQEAYKIKAGETVNLKLDSVEGMHSIQIKKTDYVVNGGKTVAVNISKPGTYEVICSRPCGTGHAQMKTTLVVE